MNIKKIRMKKHIVKIGLTLVLIFGTLQCGFAQTKYIDRNGVVQFEASEKLFEEVKATNKSVSAVLDVQTGQIAALSLIKGFHFKNSLMEEHFNENYIESEKYPKAIFKGKLNDLDVTKLNQNWQEVGVDGKLQLHGKEKQIHLNVMLKMVNGLILMKGSFIVAPSDFDIEIPKLVRNKIAKEVTVTLNFEFTKK